MRKHVHTLEPADVGKAWLNISGKRWDTSDWIGQVLPIDVGKRVYLVDGILQVENDAQRDARVEARAAAATVPPTPKHEPCAPGCIGWAVMDVNRYPEVEIQRCDVCGLYSFDEEAQVAGLETLRHLLSGNTLADSIAAGHALVAMQPKALAPKTLSPDGALSQPELFLRMSEYAAIGGSDDYTEACDAFQSKWGIDPEVEGWRVVAEAREEFTDAH